MALILAALSLVMLVVRVHAARTLGFGDSEALYACYALHPQPAYLDHPGLIGLVARALGNGLAPSPFAAHLLTAFAATAFPWLGVLAARAAGSSGRSAFVAGLVYAVTPEIAVGLFGMTPDLLLAFAWLGAITLAMVGLRSPASSLRAAVCLLGAGLLAGIATTAKVSGALLFPVLVLAYTGRAGRAYARSAWPWAGLVAGAILLAPILAFEARTGWPMLHHRLVETQRDAGVSFRNLGALLGGQFVYLSPVLAVAAVLTARALWRDFWRGRGGDAGTALLFFATFVPMAVLLPLLLWSRVAEPHWLAPAWLVLPVYAARGAAQGIRTVGRRLVTWGVAVAFTMTAAVHGWVLVPALTRLVPASYDPRLDLANELVGWSAVARAVREVAIERMPPGTLPGEVAIVGPHWVLCAQLHASLRETWPLPSMAPLWTAGCATPIRDDFDRWSPRPTWQGAETIVFVTDNRFEVEPAALFPDHVVQEMQTVTIRRGNRIARVFRLFVLTSRSRA